MCPRCFRRRAVARAAVPIFIALRLTVRRRACGLRMKTLFMRWRSIRTITCSRGRETAAMFSRWGRAEFRGAGNVELLARSGNVDNPDRNWSPWKKIDLSKDAETGVPSARYAQWKAVLHAGNTKPDVESVTLNYLPKNVAPEIEEVTVQAGTRYQPAPQPAATSIIPGS